MGRQFWHSVRVSAKNSGATKHRHGVMPVSSLNQSVILCRLRRLLRLFSRLPRLFLRPSFGF